MGLMSARVRETAVFVPSTEPGAIAVPQFRVTVGELADGRGLVYAMELPWGGHETEQTFPTLAEACAAADELYQVGGGAGTWQVTRWDGWTRPTV